MRPTSDIEYALLEADGRLAFSRDPQTAGAPEERARRQRLKVPGAAPAGSARATAGRTVAAQPWLVAW